MCSAKCVCFVFSETSVLNIFHFDKHVFTMISGFRRDVDENCALLGHYATLSGSSVPSFRDNQSKVKKSKKKSFILGLVDP